MKLAFDYDGTLYQQAALRWLAQALVRAGHEVSVISWVHPHQVEGRHREVRELAKELSIDFKGIHVVTGNVVEDKIRVMREHGITWIVDDSHEVAHGVRAAGLHSLHVGNVPTWAPETAWEGSMACRLPE
jgi:hypothetical protein